MTTSPATRSGALNARRIVVWAPIDTPASTARSIPKPSSTGQQVVLQLGVGVRVAHSRRRGVAVSAGVVGDHPMPGSLQSREEPITT